MGILLNRFANIFYHYYSGALLGFRLRLWPKERQYSLPAQLLALILYLSQLAVLLLLPLPPTPRLGLALIVFSPQWVYSLPVIPYPVFEFRAYSMAMGAALLLSSLPLWAIAPIALIWLSLSIHRRHQLTEPLRFWSQAQEENQ